MPKHRQKPGRPRNRAAGTPPPAGTNPVDNPRFTRPLVKALREHIDAFTAAMAGPNPRHRDLEAVRPCAVAWVYYSVLVAWAEDHGLVDPWLRVDAKPRRELYAPREAGGMRGWLARAYASLCVHPATWCLLDPRYSELRAHHPSEEVCRDLVDWWSSDAPSLVFETTAGPGSITGWLVGDLLQALSTTRNKGNALAQTPWWLADGILDLTLVPAATQFRDEPVLRVMDPACGTGHFLIRAIDYLWDWYTTGHLEPRQARVPAAIGGPRLDPAEAIRRILAGVHGVELDPLTAAVARLRVTAVIADLMHRSGLIPARRLDALPPFQPRIAVGDSLLAGTTTAEEYARLRPAQAAIINLGTTPAATPVQTVLFP